MTDRDPGAVPDDDLRPRIHPRLAHLIHQTDLFRTALAVQRLQPMHDANVRMRVIELEKMGVWFPELIPERGRRACETTIMATLMFLRKQNAIVPEIITALPGVVIGGRAVAEAYEQASAPGVLRALNAIEACFEESAGAIFQSSTNDELRDAALQLVTALRMQDGPKTGPPADDASGA